MVDSLLTLLQRHRLGDPLALGALVEHLRPWLIKYIERRMGSRLATVEAPDDLAHDVLVRVLEKGPSFVPSDEDQLLRLVATMAMNRIRDRYDWMAVRGRASNSVTWLGASSTPSRAAIRNEEDGLVELALALLDPDDALIIHEHGAENRDFSEIALQMEITRDAARMRHARAVYRLAKMVKKLEEGDLGDLATDMPNLVH